jgi:hypothetical protein
MLIKLNPHLENIPSRCALMFSIVVNTAIICQLIVNPVDPSGYSWLGRKVSDNTTDCQYYNPSVGIFCVSTIPLSGCAYGIMIPDYVTLSEAIITPNKGIFLTYNYTGPDWILKVGVFAGQ